MTRECLLVTRRSNRRNVIKIDIIPILSTHLRLNNLGKVHKSLAIILRRPMQELTKLYSILTLARHPLCSKTITINEGRLNQAERIILDRTIGNKHIIPTTKFRNTKNNPLGRLRIISFHVLQDITENLTFTSTTTNITSPKSNTDCSNRIMNISSNESRDYILTTHCANVEKQINTRICS